MFNQYSVNQSIRPVNTRINEKGNLEVSNCDLVQLAQDFKTPLYVVDEETLTKMAKEFIEAFSKYENTKILFASKALMTGSIAKILANLGFGFDVVSNGEIHTLLNAGIDLLKSSFNGNNKSKEEIEYAIDNNIDHFSVDNLCELELLNEIAKNKNKIQKIHLRVNPRIECHTHEYIQTGQIDSKFGIDIEKIEEVTGLILNKYPNLNLVGLHAHIGSQIFETKVFEDEIEILLNKIKKINQQYNINLNEINIGGGYGVKYVESDTPLSIYEFAQVIINAIEKNCEKLNLLKPVLYIEPGRSLVCNAGFTLYTIGSEKNIEGIRKYITIDGGMADNIRPSLYQAQYSAQIANKKDIDNYEVVTVAGKFCESGDILIKDIELNNPKKGDVLCVFATGAYCYSMSSNYNRMLKPAMVLINQGKADIIVKRQTLDDLVSNDIILERLK